MKVVRVISGAAGVIGVLVASLVASISYAEEETVIEEMVVTGSRIVRSGADAPTPMTVATAEQFQLTGEINLGDYLNELPQLRSTFSLQQGTQFIGTTGLNILSLRGLGTSRTLVLQDGRRHIGSTNGSSAVDVNTIPQALLERVEIITGGASAIYGADAVTGVVNFILKDDFEGLTVSAQGSLPEDEGGETVRTAITWGMNFSEGRGNVAFSADWTDVSDIYGPDRDWIARNPAAVYNPADTGPDDGIPNLLYVNNTRDIRFANGPGMIWGPSSLNVLAGVGGEFLAGFGYGLLGGPYTFDENGDLKQFDEGQTFVRYDGQIGGNAIGGDGLNFGDSEQLLPDVERLNLFGRVRYDFNDHLTVKAEGKYTKTESSSLFFPSFFFLNDESFIVPDNAFLSDELREKMFTETFFPGVGFYLNRINYDLGFRTTDVDRETMRFVVSAQGEIAGGWMYDAGVVYSEYEGDFLEGNNLNLVKSAFAIDAVVDGDGQIVCRSAEARADGCVPLNLFGENQFDPAARDYVMEDDTTWTEDMKQTVFSAHATGPVFSLPAGQVMAAFGGEYRKEESKVVYADIIKSGDTLFNALADSDADYDVIEGFAEVSVPLISGVRGFQDVTLDAAIRLSDYDTIGSTTTWKFGLEWQPIDDLRMRTTLSKAVRAPNIGEFYDPLSQNFFAVDDPCSDTEIPFAPDPALREKNCVALGKPDGYNSINDGATIGGLSGGNVNLQEETADSWTIGVVVTPRFVENLAITVDYWDIEIEDAISAVSAQNTLDKCVDGPSIDNIYCPNIRRDADDFDINADNGITSQTLNIAALEARGIDYEVNYIWDLAQTFSSLPGMLDFRLMGQHLIQLDEFEFQEEPDNATRVDGSLGDPTDQFQLSVTYRTAKITASWRYRWLDSMRTIGWDTDNEDRSPYKTTSWGYHELQGRYLFDSVLGGSLELFGGVRNLTDEEPEYPFTGNGGGSGMYDVYGRTYYFGVQYDMGQ